MLGEWLMRPMAVGFWSMVCHILQQDPNEGIDNPNLMILVLKGVLVGSGNHGVGSNRNGPLELGQVIKNSLFCTNSYIYST